MGPENARRKMDDLFKNLKNINFQYTTFPVNSFKFPDHKQETIAEIIARLDEMDEIVDVMTRYPQAEKMLTALFNKEK